MDKARRPKTLCVSVQFIVSLLCYQRMSTVALFMVSHPKRNSRWLARFTECALTAKKNLPTNAIKLLGSQARALDSNSLTWFDRARVLRNVRSKRPTFTTGKCSGPSGHAVLAYVRLVQRRTRGSVTKQEKGFRKHVDIAITIISFGRGMSAKTSMASPSPSTRASMSIKRESPLIEQCSSPVNSSSCARCIEPVLGDTVIDNDISRFGEQIHEFKSSLAADKARLNNPAATLHLRYSAMSLKQPRLTRRMVKRPRVSDQRLESAEKNYLKDRSW